MRVQTEVLARVAELARLRLEPGEADRLQQELSTILDHVDSLAQIDHLAPADGPAPGDDLASEEGGPLDSAARPSPDRSAEEPGAAAHQPPHALPVNPARQAPQWEEGFFVVPRLPAMDGTVDRRPPAADTPSGEGEQSG